MRCRPPQPLVVEWPPSSTVVLPVGKDDVIKVADNDWVVPSETTFV